MPMYDQNGIPIIGKEDDSKRQIVELSKSLMMARGLINELQEKVGYLRANNTNILTFLFYLMGETDNNRFRVSIKKLESLRAEFLSHNMILKTYQDKAKNIVIYRENTKRKEDNKNGKNKNK